MTPALASAVDEAILAREIADAKLSVALDHLQAVLSTLAKAAGSPEERQAWQAARAFLVESGRGQVERKEWIDRVCVGAEAKP